MLDVGSWVATPRSSANAAQLARTVFPSEHVATLERWIDTLDESLPPLRQFILPGGSISSAQLHIARAVCRRLERALVDAWTFSAEQTSAGDDSSMKHPAAVEGVRQRVGDLSLDVDSAIVLRYVNRLSDFLFVAARVAASPAPDRVYKKGATAAHEAASSATSS